MWSHLTYNSHKPSKLCASEAGLAFGQRRGAEEGLRRCASSLLDWPLMRTLANSSLRPQPRQSRTRPGPAPSEKPKRATSAHTCFPSAGDFLVILKARIPVYFILETNYLSPRHFCPLFFQECCTVHHRRFRNFATVTPTGESPPPNSHQTAWVNVESFL
jgi:hypothetical protein